MAEESYPNASHNSGEVTTQEWEQLAVTGLGTGLIGLPPPAQTYVVYADGTGTRTIHVRSGKRAVVRGMAWYSGSADFDLPALSANSSGSTRTDRIVLRLTRASGEVTIEVVEGIPGAGAPSVTQDDGTTGVWEFALADVTVADGATTLADSTVTPKATFVGEQPVICTSTTRPGHRPSRMIVETDTGRVYVSDGSSWLSLYDDSGWVTASAASGWAFDGRTKYRKHAGWVCVNVAARRSGAAMAEGSNSTILTLPSGYAPAFNSMTLNGYVDGSRLARARVDSSGQIVLDNYNYTFEQGWFFSGTVSYPV